MVQIKSDITIGDRFLRCLLERYYRTYSVAPQSLDSQQLATGTPTAICHLLPCFSNEGHWINTLTPQPLRCQHQELQGTTEKKSGGDHQKSGASTVHYVCTPF